MKISSVYTVVLVCCLMLSNAWAASDDARDRIQVFFKKQDKKQPPMQLVLKIKAVVKGNENVLDVKEIADHKNGFQGVEVFVKPTASEILSERLEKEKKAYPDRSIEQVEKMLEGRPTDSTMQIMNKIREHKDVIAVQNLKSVAHGNHVGREDRASFRAGDKVDKPRSPFGAKVAKSAAANEPKKELTREEKRKAAVMKSKFG